MPYLLGALTEELVANRFAHFLQGRVERFLLPGLPAMNFQNPIGQQRQAGIEVSVE